MARFILRRNAVRERVAREGWRETAVVEKKTDICTCFPNPPRPGEKRSGSRPCEEGKERRKTWRTKKRCIYIYRERNKERKIRKDGLFDSFHSPSYISSYIYDRGKSCFRRDSNTEEESTMGGATRGKDKSKTCATLMNYVDPVPS